MSSQSPDPHGSSRNPQLSGIQILFASILAIGLLLAINFSGRIAAGQRIQRDRQALEAEIATLEAEQAVLQQDLEFARSDQYVEAWARSEGKMIREGEVLVVPVPAGAPLPTPSPTLAPIPVAGLEEESVIEPWRVWWALFFDTDPPF